MSKIKERFSEYRRKFKQRETKIEFIPSRNPIRNEKRKSFTSYNEAAFEDLEIRNVWKELKGVAPNPTQSLLDYLGSFVTNPLNDLDDLRFRQETISELHEDEGIRKRATSVKESADVFRYSRKYDNRSLNFQDSSLQVLENAKTLVDFVDAVKINIPDAKSPFLKEIVAFANQLDNDKGFNVVRNFLGEVYVQGGLGDAIYNLERSLHFLSLGGTSEKRRFFANTRVLTESLETLLVEDSQKEFISAVEGRAVDVLNSLKERISQYNKELFRFGGNEDSFQRQNNENFLSMINYSVDLLKEAVEARMPTVDLKDLPEELGVYIAAANLQNKWQKNRRPVTRPTLLDKIERRTNIRESYNTTLISSSGKAVTPNDIISNPDGNLFVIEGPNNGGKTTYIRQVGQMYWLAQLGMWIPAKKADISVVDGIYTSIGSADDTEAGTGQYLTELNRVCEFTSPSNGTLHTTPYSLLFFDEFANGTDHEEAVYRTRVVLDHLSMKGVTSYFTTHKHEIGKMIENGEIEGGVNLASEVKRKGKTIKTTYRILRNAREGSYGNVIAEERGVTPEKLKENMVDEIRNSKYDSAHTRMNGAGKRK